ncbi:GNAT family N-acetyltransferase [Brevibacillus borstelensis]|uniref:GNAT family N-acetyltransferase n=1 Tax=Brevibacillus borstelensis TaxID=45462 RepID=UPI000469F5C0|nr:GNAT family N-acetyltransferase [Brevibacillus borstelensis]KKX55842.1 acetyltransferase [Brevibacillus borstelensis cifa_chp40]MCM3472592.1 GNAT family N-acetyltransferase [Brevibacillus borstelensis]MCM3561866.1 GNAT family N-acetyltransferase [Brevibacillus borstelensis]MCM3592459.1 GNAT family N-acetyltransferase [Brevibacillus borstelensis]MCM3625507.1 GNAT family N-acetyltransferase [Brevibacillus borstelensis]
MIRYAAPEDASWAAPLIYEAIGDIAHTLTGADKQDEAIKVMEQFFREKQNRISHENCMIAVAEGKPAGLLISYHGSRTEELDRPFAKRLEQLTGTAPIIVKEARSDEYYLDTLVVDPNYRGKGIGTRLLASFEEEAIRQGYERTALLVEKDNVRARQLYEHIGYQMDGSVMVSGHLYDHMVKMLAVPI